MKAICALAVLIPLLAGCISSSSPPPPAQNTTVVVCPNGGGDGWLRFLGQIS